MRVKRIHITGNQKEEEPTLWDLSEDINSTEELEGHTIIDENQQLYLVIHVSLPGRVTYIYPKYGRIECFDSGLNNIKEYRVLPAKAFTRVVHEASVSGKSFTSKIEVVNLEELVEDYKAQRVAPETMQDWKVGVWYKRPSEEDEVKRFIKVTKSNLDGFAWIEVLVSSDTNSADVTEYWNAQGSFIKVRNNYIRMPEDFNISIESL